MAISKDCVFDIAIKATNRRPRCMQDEACTIHPSRPLSSKFNSKIATFKVKINYYFKNHALNPSQHPHSLLSVKLTQSKIKQDMILTE